MDEDKAADFGIYDEDGEEIDCSLIGPTPDERRVERQIEIINAKERKYKELPEYNDPS